MSDGVRMECHKCGYRCTPQWLNDEAHCLKCQAVLRRRPVGAGAGAGAAVVDEGRRECGEVSTYKHRPGSAMESSSGGDCRRSPDGVHHWKFGKCTFCQQSEPPRGKPAPTLGNTARHMLSAHAADGHQGAPLPASPRQPSPRQPSPRQASGHAYSSSSAVAAAPFERGERVKMECPHCGYKCVPQWLNDEAHCLKCQAVLIMQPSIHGGERDAMLGGTEARRQPGEVSTFKHASASAMESASGDCARSPDGLHHWKFGKCNYCQKPEGKQVKGAGAKANPGGAAGCSAGGKCVFKFAKCSKCGRKEF